MPARAGRGLGPISLLDLRLLATGVRPGAQGKVPGSGSVRRQFWPRSTGPDHRQHSGQVVLCFMGSSLGIPRMKPRMSHKCPWEAAKPQQSSADQAAGMDLAREWVQGGQRQRILEETSECLPQYPHRLTRQPGGRTILNIPAEHSLALSISPVTQLPPLSVSPCG